MCSLIIIMADYYMPFNLMAFNSCDQILGYGKWLIYHQKYFPLNLKVYDHWSITEILFLGNKNLSACWKKKLL